MRSHDEEEGSRGGAIAAAPAPARTAGIGLVVRGIGRGALRLERDVLQAFPVHQVGPLPIVCFTGRAVREERIYQGWLLRSILEHCGLMQVERARLKQSLILCHAQDGYRALFTWHELFNSAVGQQAVVVPEHDGRLTLVSAADLRAGPRNLQRLAAVEWRELPD